MTIVFPVSINLDLMRSLGASEIIDYTIDNFH